MLLLLLLLPLLLLLLLSMLLLVVVLLTLVPPRLLLLRMLMLLPPLLLLPLLPPPERPWVLLVLLVLPLLRAPQGERNGDVAVCSMQQNEEYDGQHGKNRRRRERNTEAHSERAGKRKAREEQHGAPKNAKRTNDGRDFVEEPPIHSKLLLLTYIAQAVGYRSHTDRINLFARDIYAPAQDG
jgi:hypothetical protein